MKVTVKARALIFHMSTPSGKTYLGTNIFDSVTLTLEFDLFKKKKLTLLITFEQ